MKKKYYHYWRNALFASFLLGLAPGKIMAQDLATIAYKSKKPAKTTLQQTGRSLKEVLKEVQSLYKVDFAYQENLISQKFLVFKPKDGQDLDKVLQEILTPLGLIYQKIDETQYAIVGETKANPPVNFDFLPLLFASSYQAGTRPITNAGIIKAAEVNVSGVVTGENGEALPGVTVQVKGTTIGATTDVNGGYNLSVPDNATTLVFSYIGYVAQEVAIGNRTTINVGLRPDAKSLEEVVVIGYGSVKKREVTGAVTSVKPEDFNKGAVTDPMQLIQGKVAGLSVTRTNGGDPTAGLEIRLRGTTSLAGGGQTPLIVVDGIPGGWSSTFASSSGIHRHSALLLSGG